MHSRYNQQKANVLSERGRRMAKTRWDADRARRDAEMSDRIREIAEWDTINLPRRTGDALGCFQYTDYRTGKVRKWVVRIGDRSDQITVEAPGEKPSLSHGWSWLFETLRKKILSS